MFEDILIWLGCLDFPLEDRGKCTSTVLSLPVAALSVILISWVSLEALVALVLTCNAAWAFAFSAFLSFAFFFSSFF